MKTIIIPFSVAEQCLYALIAWIEHNPNDSKRRCAESTKLYLLGKIVRAEEINSQFVELEIKK